ncbi:hypothetical protein [Bartonella mastomydis]|uniref:hypothetical protein n=1 Tax=Bartonella mastomydis TaxID=1820002 RepID=UPI0015D60CFC|nr:hypothetical protein [Bartonella mastomydis]
MHKGAVRRFPVFAVLAVRSHGETSCAMALANLFCGLFTGLGWFVIAKLLGLPMGLALT